MAGSKSPVARAEILPLTGLRFVAAFYVFLFHVHIRWPLAASRFACNILDVGAVGMSLFFMLSGFVLAHRYGGPGVRYRSYLANRFARIYPVYAVAALLTVPWIGVSFAADPARGLGELAVLLLSNLLLLQAWLPPLFNYWNDGGSWSISAEAFFYLLFPSLLRGLSGRPVRQVVWVGLVAYFLAVLPGLCSAVFGPAPSHGVFYSVPVYRLPEFVFGVCVYLATRHARPGRWVDGACLIAVLGLAAYLGLVGMRLPLYVGHDWLVLPVIALVLVALSQPRGLVVAALASPPLAWAGRVSYCFYSFQPLVILPLLSYREQLARRIPLLADNRALALAAFLLLLGVSGIAYHVLEEPLRRRLRDRFAHRPAAPLREAA